MIAAIYSLALSTLLFAQPNDDLAQQIERARQAVKESQAKLDDAEERVDRLQKQQDAQRDRARLLLDDAQRPAHRRDRRSSTSAALDRVV